MFRISPAADRLSIGAQTDRGAWMQVTEIVVCGFIGHRPGLLTYDTFEVCEAFDPEENEFYEYCRDIEVPFIGCLRCLAEVELELPPAVPVDVVDWR